MWSYEGEVFLCTLSGPEPTERSGFQHSAHCIARKPAEHLCLRLRGFMTTVHINLRDQGRRYYMAGGLFPQVRILAPPFGPG